MNILQFVHSIVDGLGVVFCFDGGEDGDLRLIELPRTVEYTRAHGLYNPVESSGI